LLAPAVDTAAVTVLASDTFQAVKKVEKITKVGGTSEASSEGK